MENRFLSTGIPYMEGIRKQTIICIGCPKGCRIEVEGQGDDISSVSGYECGQGRKYAVSEYRNPTRILTTTVRVRRGLLPLVSVKTEAPIPRRLIRPAMERLAGIVIEAPVDIGQTVAGDLLATGVRVVATAGVPRVQGTKGEAS